MEIDKILFIKNTIIGLQDKKYFASKDSDVQKISYKLRKMFINYMTNKLKQAKDINACLVIEKETNYFFVDKLDQNIDNEKHNEEIKELDKDLDQKIRSSTNVLQFFYTKLQKIFKFIKEILFKFGNIHNFDIQYSFTETELEYISLINHLKEMGAILQNNKDKEIMYQRIARFLARQQEELANIELTHLLTINKTELADDKELLNTAENELNDISANSQYQNLSLQKNRRLNLLWQDYEILF